MRVPFTAKALHTIGVIDRVSNWLGALAAWLFFVTGLMLSYEVVARYFFNAPTVWAAEISQLFLIWGTFLAMARVLAHRQHIRIEVALSHLGERGRRAADVFAHCIIVLFCAVVAWYGWAIAYDSFVRGRSTGTMLNIPNWLSEMVIPLGFGWLAVQSLVELHRLLYTGRATPGQTS